MSTESVHPHFTPVHEVVPDLPVHSATTASGVPVATPRSGGPGRTKAPTVELPKPRLISFPTVYNGEEVNAQFSVEWHSITSAKTKATKIYAVPQKPANFEDLRTFAVIVGEERFVDAVWRGLLIPAGKQASNAIGDAPFTDTGYITGITDELDYSRSSLGKKQDLLEDHLKLSAEQNEIMTKMQEHFSSGTPLPSELRARATQIALRITEILTAIEAINNKPKKAKAKKDEAPAAPATA